MSFTDPLIVTATAAGPMSLPRISTEGDKTIYSSPNGDIVITVDHTVGKRTRRVIRIDLKKFSPDPHKPSENLVVTMSSYIVFDLPLDGFSITEANLAWDGLTGLLLANSRALLVKFLGGES